MDGHRDGISCMAKNPNYLKGIFSASMDGGKYLHLVFSDVNLDDEMIYGKGSIHNELPMMEYL